MAGRIVAIGPNGHRQTRKLQKNAGWSDPAKQDSFLAHVEMTCNVREAAALIGLSPSGAYARRRKDAEFRERWDAAIDEGRRRLWGELLAVASRELAPIPVSPDAGPVSPDAGDDAGEARPIDTKLALDLLKLHAAGRAPSGGVKPRHRAPMSAEELRVLVFAKLQDKRKELTGDV